VVCVEMRASPSIYSLGMVGLEKIFMHAHMQPSWRRHQEMPRGRRRRLVPLGCGRTLGATAPRLPLVGCYVGLGRFHVGAWPRLDG